MLITNVKICALFNLNHFFTLGRFCECQEDQEVTCSPDCQNGGSCECGQCKCPDGFIGKCCQFEDCETGKCTEEEEEFCGGIGDAACSGNTILELIRQFVSDS